MKSGIELIAEERQEQISKHGRTVENDVKYNNDFQLAQGASLLLQKSFKDDDDSGLDDTFRMIIPIDWDKSIMQKMFDKPYKERLIIAGALIAAELDRLQNNKPNDRE